MIRIMKILRFWFPLCFYSVMIFYVSSLPGGPGGIAVPGIDKVLHFIEYSPFGFLLAFALVKTLTKSDGLLVLLFVFLGSFIYGLTDEIHQSFVPHRDMSIFDVVADIFGGFGGGYSYYLINKRKNNINNRKS